MNSLGLFSFFLVLFFLQFHLLMLGLCNNSAYEVGKVEGYLLEIEEASFIRANLEQNLDFIVEETMLRAALLSEDPEFIGSEVQEKIFSFLQDAEEKYSGKLAFYAADIDPGDYGKSMSGKIGKVLEKGILQKNSHVMVLKIKELAFAEFTYFGGPMKREIIFSEIKLPEFSQIFAMPADYTRRVVVVV